jgi:hypothetical protein
VFQALTHKMCCREICESFGAEDVAPLGRDYTLIPVPTSRISSEM